MGSLAIVVLALFPTLMQATVAAPSAEGLDTTAIAKIKDEGLNRSKVMELESYLTDVYSPRLTWSPEYKEAARWVAGKLGEWGLQNIHFEYVGPQGRGWTLKKFSSQVLGPNAFPLIAYPKAWSASTQGLIQGEAIIFRANNEADLQKYRGRLKNAFILLADSQKVIPHFQPEASRLADSTLLELANAVMPERRLAFSFPDSVVLRQRLLQAQFEARKMEFCQNEGAAVLLDAGRGDGGTLVVQAASVPVAPMSASDLLFRRVYAYDPKAPQLLPQVTVAAEHYNRIVRTIQKGKTVKLEMNLEVEFSKPDSAFNIIAEIPGPDLKDEIVMIGGHFDTWHSGTGATDNSSGVAVCMEAIRIIQHLGLKPRRTIRVALWAGEEQGFLGSRSYVVRHFAGLEGDILSLLAGKGGGKLTKKGEYEKLSVYFNNDNGGGRVRGVYLQGNEAVLPIVRSWLAQYNDPTAKTLALTNAGGTDHLSFDGVGLPGFQFIQDPIEYSTRTHHSNMDVYDRIIEDDLKQAATVMAFFAYSAAMYDARLPRIFVPGL